MPLTHLLAARCPAASPSAGHAQTPPTFFACRAWVVRFGKQEPSFELMRVCDIDAAFETFLTAAKLFRETKGKEDGFLEHVQRG